MSRNGFQQVTISCTVTTRVGAIDIGSNGIRLLIADDSGDGRFRVVAAERAAVRLGHHTFTSGRLDPTTASQAVEAVSRFASILEAHGVEHVRGVATSAVRDAKDGDRFVARVRRACGLEVEVISGTEESRLVHRAVVERAPIGEAPWMVADLGGGSLELALCDRERIRWSESRQIGTVRLLEQHEDLSPKLLARRISDHMDGFRLLHNPDGLQVAGLVLCGGNSNALARMVGMQPKDGDPVALTRAQLADLVEELAARTPEERMATWGFRADRADVVLPAALVYQRVAAVLGLEVLHVTGWGLREGLALDMLDERLRPGAREARMEVGLHASAAALGRAMRFDEEHAEEVVRWALAVFDDLQPLHRMGGRNRRILHGAALLHEVGRALGEAGHHKHSMYIIENAEISSLSPSELRVAACVARYHRGALPRLDHPIYRELSAKDRRRVDRLAGILRVTDALAVTRRGRIQDVSAAASPEAVHIRVHTRENVDKELAAASCRNDLMRRAFGRGVVIEEA